MPLSVNCEVDFGSINKPNDFYQSRSNSIIVILTEIQHFKSLLHELSNDTAGIITNFIGNGNGNEPNVLPRKLLLLLLNGSSGIAIRVASNILPHTV
jgi:DNA gyrase/topoisomerase IV subunit A